MSTNSTSAFSEEEDPRLLHAAQEYLAEVETGRRPERKAFVARFPEVAADLGPYLDAIDLMHGSASLRSSSGGKPALVEVPPAEPLGDFRIVREIGRGGMGVVYEALQLSLGRRVALKVLPFAAALDAKHLQRFQNEAQAAAHLHHTNIVPVYAVGCERGVHYYAMQLIEGQNLADLIAQLRAQEQPPRQRGTAQAGAPPALEPTGPPAPASPAAATVAGVAAELSTQRASRSGSFYRTAARLAAQAADALEHAHQLGVIHRDVKPANLLVDGRGNVWVTDFGLAQFHSGLNLTRTGDLLGTLRYMSPEQAAGQHLPPDPRTDVYSLGATLYELLTLQPLFDGRDHARLLRQIMEEEPRPPRLVAPSVPVELETIVLKAVSKNPADRYASAQELGDDLRRFLDDRPIRARRPTLTQRLRKWVRRHPSVVGAGIVLLALVAIGSLVSAALIRQEQARTNEAYDLVRHEQALTEAAYRRERQRAEEAEERLRLARQSVDELIEVSEEWLAQMPHLEGLRRQLLARALVSYQEFIDQRRDDPEAQAELRQAKERVEKFLADLAALEGAGKLPLLEKPAVLDDLHLSTEQRTKIEQLSRQANTHRTESAPDLLKLSEEDRHQRFLEEAHEIDGQLNAILTPQQQTRLQQVALQMKGLGAFGDPAVVTGLKLTAEQRERIHNMVAEAVPPPPEPPHFGGHSGPGGRPDAGPHSGGGPAGHPFCGPPQEWLRAQEQRTRQAREQILALLTVDQKRRWKEMTGEPFKGPTDPSLPPGGPPGLPPGPSRPPR